MANQLKRETGLGGALIIGLGSILGTGAYVSVGLSATIAGNLLVWAIVIAAFTALCNGLSSAQLAAAHPVSGGTYEYGYQFLNPLSGITAGALFIVAKSASAATAALAVAWYIGRYFAWDAWATKLLAIGLLLSFCLLVLAGVRRTNWLNALLVAVSVAGLLLFIVVAYSEPSDTVTLPPASELSLFHAAALMFVAFTGYGRIATMGEEITDPQKNIPKAVLLTLGVVSAIYVAVGLAILHLGGLQSFAQDHFTLSTLIAGSSWHWLVLVAGGVAMCGVVLNLILGVSRVVLAMGRRGDLPHWLGRLDKQGNSAPAATFVTFVVMALIVVSGGIQSAWTLSAFTVLVYYGITNLAALKVADEQRFVPKWISLAGLMSCFGLVILALMA